MTQQPKHDHLSRAQLEALYARETGSIAFLDESYRQHRGRDNTEIPFYAMAAAIVEVDQLADLRREIEGYGAWRNNRMEWHTNQDLREDPARAAALINTINSSGVFNIITVRVPVQESGENAARNAALARLAHEVTQGAGAPRLLVADHFNETKEPGRARKDRNLIGALRHNGLVPDGTTMQHGHPGEEQLLWVPDLVAYTFRRHMALGEDEWFPRFENVRALSADGPDLTRFTDPLTRRSSHVHQQGPGARLLGIPENRATAVSSGPILAWEQASAKDAGTVKNNARPSIVLNENRAHTAGVEDHLIAAVVNRDPRRILAAAQTLAQAKPSGKSGERLRAMLDKTAGNLEGGRARVNAIIDGTTPALPPAQEKKPPRQEPPQQTTPQTGPQL
ncbi:hypothetical protein [Galactobacter valiniphilus]|uniref:hypothetical protein n=1 Tax=Galactobacter valiniphilus TaxID=2676122 RepID=UPI003735210F